MAASSGSRGLRVILIVLFCLLAVGGGGYLWLRANYKDVIRKKLPGIAAKATDSLYQVQAGDFDVDLVNRRVVITDFDFVPDRDAVARLRSDLKLPRILLAIHIDTVVLEDIDWTGVLRTKEIACGAMRIAHPVIRITKTPGESDTTEAEPKEPPKIRSIAAGSIVVDNPDVTFSSAVPGKSASYRLLGGQILLTDWRFDLRRDPDSSRLFYASNTVIKIRSFNIEDKDGLYNIKTGNILYDQQASRAVIRDFAVKPAVSREAFYRRVRTQKEIYSVRVPELTLNGLLWTRLIRDGELITEAPAQLKGADIGVYMSRVPPPSRESKNGKFPQQMIRKLTFPFSIPRLDISGGHMTYTEKNEKTMREGKLELKGVSGTVSNLTNKPDLLRRNGTLTVALRASMLGAPLNAKFHLNMNSPQGAFTLRAHGGGFDGKLLNPLLKPLALAEIREGRFDALDVDLSGSEAGARATMTLRYTNLETDLFQMKEDKQMKRSKILSFAASKLLTHDDNPSKNGALRVVHPNYRRDPTKSFFNMIWGTVFTGALQTASRDIVELDKAVNKRKKKQEKEREESGK